jgi:hypothetical protein
MDVGLDHQALDHQSQQADQNEEDTQRRRAGSDECACPYDPSSAAVPDHH